MTNELIKYDPEFPFAIIVADKTVAKFKGISQATSLFNLSGLNYEVIDTTPKPKIPEDAEFVQWDASDQSFYAMRYGKTDEWWVTASGHKEDSFYYLSDLLILISDAEVTVLVRKEES